MKRRALLFTAAALPVIVGGSAYLLVRNGPEPPLAAALRARLPTLKLPRETLEVFSQDYARAGGRFRKKRANDALVQQFLLSTDFFPAANEAAELTYVAFHDPERGVCHNPFRGT
jgi:hypothetical protein